MHFVMALYVKNEKLRGILEIWGPWKSQKIEVKVKAGFFGFLKNRKKRYFCLSNAT